MFNLVNSCTVTGEYADDTDPETGRAIYKSGTYMVNQPCAFSVLSAEQVTQNWGDGLASESSAVRASLVLPSWAPGIYDPSAATIAVSNYPGTWRIVALRPGAQWTTHLLTASSNAN